MVEKYQDEFINENDKRIKIEENNYKTKKEGCYGKKKKRKWKNQNQKWIISLILMFFCNLMFI